MLNYKAVGAAALATLFVASPVRAQILTHLKSPRISINTGDRVGNFRHAFTDTKKRAVYEGRQYAIMARSLGGGLTVRIATGDPLPAPLAGTFNRFEWPAVNDNGDVLFFAHMNTTSTDTGYFLQLAGGALLHVDGGLALRAGEPGDINTAGDVVWTNRQRYELYYYSFAAGTGTNTLVAQDGDATVPNGGTWRRFGRRPVISDNGTIAFYADLGPGDEGIFSYGAGVFTEIARIGAPSPAPGLTYASFNDDQTIAIDDAGRVAFHATLAGGAPGAEGVFLFDPAGAGTTITVALEGDPVAGGPVGAIVAELELDFVAVDDLGRVALHADVDPVLADHRVLIHTAPGGGGILQVHSPTLSFAKSFSPRMTDSIAALPGTTAFEAGPSNDIQVLTPGPGVVSVINSFVATPLGLDVMSYLPSISRTGEMVWLAEHGELYVDAFAGAGPFKVHEAGDPSPALGLLVTIRLAGHAMSRRHGAFVVADNGMVPGGGFGAYAHAIGMFSLKQPNVVFRVAASGDPAPLALGGQIRLHAGGPMVIKGRNVIFISEMVGGAASEAILMASPAGLPIRNLLATGVATPVGPFVQFYTSSPMVMKGRWLAFSGVYGGAPDIGTFVMRWNNPATLQLVARVGDPFPNGGLIDNIGAYAVNGNGEVLYAASSDLGGAGIFFRNQLGNTSVIVLSGDPVPVAVDPTAIFDFDDEPALGLADAGDMFFGTAFQYATTLIDEGLFHYDGITLTPLILTNVTAAPAGGTFIGVDTAWPLTATATEVFGTFNTSMEGYREALMSVPY